MVYKLGYSHGRPYPDGYMGITAHSDFGKLPIEPLGLLRLQFDQLETDTFTVWVEKFYVEPNYRRKYGIARELVTRAVSELAYNGQIASISTSITNERTLHLMRSFFGEKALSLYEHQDFEGITEIGSACAEKQLVRLRSEQQSSLDDTADELEVDLYVKVDLGIARQFAGIQLPSLAE